MALPERPCIQCAVTKPIDAFEVTTKDGKCRRAICKPCYSLLKKDRARAGAASHDPEAVPKPAACTNCGKGPDEVNFKWRKDVIQGGWRTECNACYNEKNYSEAYRKRERARDEDAYLARNAATHMA